MHSNNPFSASAKVAVLACLIALIVTALLSASLLTNLVDYRNSDFFSYWLAGRSILDGSSPYGPRSWTEGHLDAGATWLSDETFLYPLPLAVILAPFGALAIDAAFTAWTFLSTISITLAVLIMTRRVTTPWSYVIPLLAAVFLFRPTILSYLNGQIAAFLLLAGALVIALIRDRRWVACGLVLSLFILKPSIGLPIFLLFGAWFILRGKAMPFLGMALGTSALLLISLAFDAYWLQEYLSVGTAKLVSTIGYSPTIWGNLGDLVGEYSTYFLPLGVAFSALAAVLILFVTWRLPPSENDVAASAILGTALLITPYLWAYDLLLLVVPISVATSRLAKSPRSYLLGALFPLALAATSLALIKVAELVGRDAWSSLLAVAAVATVLATAQWRAEVGDPTAA